MDLFPHACTSDADIREAPSGAFPLPARVGGEALVQARGICWPQLSRCSGGGVWAAAAVAIIAER
jgi:hypothetical protein